MDMFLLRHSPDKLIVVFFFFTLIDFLMFCWVGVHVAFTKLLTIYHTWIHPLHHFPSFPAPPIPGIVSTDNIFPFTYMCTQYFYHIHPPTLFPHLLPPPTGTNPPRQDLFCPPSFWFCIWKEEEKNDFLLQLSPV
jgi:hypothetical protein